MKKLLTLTSLALAGSLAACSGTPAAPDLAATAEQQAASPGDPGTLATTSSSSLRESGRGGSGAVVVYVISQDLFFDSIIGPDLPPHGRFQKLEMAGPSGLQTEFGPGDPGYLGGRWWVDVNGNGEMDDGDNFFSCPLLGPGRENP